jgi:hypothetical protein
MSTYVVTLEMGRCNVQVSKTGGHLRYSVHPWKEG